MAESISAPLDVMDMNTKGCRHRHSSNDRERDARRGAGTVLSAGFGAAERTGSPTASIHIDAYSRVVAEVDSFTAGLSGPVPIHGSSRSEGP